MPNIKLLHIIEDAKFYDYLKATFEFGDFENTYAKYHEINLPNLSKSYDLVFIHYLKADYLNLLNDKYFPINKIVWYVWGADLFCLGAFFNENLLPKTLQNREKSWKIKGFPYFLKMKFHALFPRLFDWHRKYAPIRKSLKLIKNAVTLIPKDGELLAEKYNSNINHWHINYVDPIFANTPNEAFNSGDNILLGNSSEFTNNHIDFLETVDIADVSSFHFIIPLSYGDTYNADFVEQYVNKKMANNARIMRGFMPFNEYTQLLSACEIAVMPHLRQQALGNVIKLLYGGCHLYFYAESGVYQFLYKNGFLVSKIDSLFIPKKLNQPEKLKNRELTIQYFGKNIIQERILKMIKSLI